MREMLFVMVRKRILNDFFVKYKQRSGVDVRYKKFHRNFNSHQHDTHERIVITHEIKHSRLFVVIKMKNYSLLIVSRVKFTRASSIHFKFQPLWRFLNDQNLTTL